MCAQRQQAAFQVCVCDPSITFDAFAARSLDVISFRILIVLGLLLTLAGIGEEGLSVSVLLI